MKLVYFVSRAVNKIKRLYINRVFYERTGQRASLIGDIVLINTNLKIGKNVSIYPHVQLFGDGLIEIGDNVSIGTGTIIYASKSAGVKIGSNSMIAGQCYIIDTDHGIKGNAIIRTQENTHAPIEIGEDVWIASNVTILKGSVIHNGAVVGAKALVNGELSPNSISVGIPAKTIKFRE